VGFYYLKRNHSSIKQKKIMHKDLEEYTEDDELHYDLCIVGSGPAGCAIAKKFLGGKTRVLILESGSLDPTYEHQLLNKGESIGPRKLNLLDSRLRCFGGAGKLWAGMCRPMSAQDFKKREYMDISGWAISEEHLENYYKEAADILGIEYERFSDNSWSEGAAVATRFSNGGILAGRRYLRSEKRDLANTYQDVLFSHQYIDVITNATVVDLVQEGESIKEIEVKSLLNKSKVVKAKIFILCAGALENPRILLNSSVDQRLRKNKYLGKCFMSHPAFTDVGKLILDGVEGESTEQVSKKQKDSFGFEVTEKEQDKSCILRHHISLKRITSKVVLSRLIKESRASFSDVIGNLKILDILSKYKSLLKEVVFSGHMVFNLDVGIEQEPRLVNRVQLSKSKDIHGKHTLEVFWDSISEIERKTVLEAIKAVGRQAMISETGVGNISPSVINHKAFLREDAINHHIGTTRMASDEGEGVVDSNLKCFGLNNLYISGSSIFPTSSIVNPTFTIIALSLRLGDHVLHKLK